MIRVVLADDHRLVRAGLEKLLAAEADIQVVGSAADGTEAVAQWLSAGPTSCSWTFHAGP